MRRFLLRLAVYLIGLVVVLEIGVRLFLPQQLIRQYEIYAPHDGLGIVLYPNLDLIINTGERDVRLLTDEHGYRLSPDSPAEGEHDLRVLALGDSFLMASQVDGAQTTAAILEQTLSDELGLRVKIDNTASPGFNLNQYLRLAQQVLDERHYDAIWVMVYGGNDYVERRVDYVPPGRPIARHDFRLPRSLNPTELVDALLFPINDFLESSSHLFILLKSRMSILLARVGLTRRTIPEAILLENASSPAWDVSGEVMGDLQEVANARGVPLIVSIVPASYQVDPSSLRRSLEAFSIPDSDVDPEQPSRLLAQSFREHGVETVVDMLPAFRERFAEAGAPLYGSIDSHLSPEGNQFAARLLLPYLVDALR